VRQPRAPLDVVLNLSRYHREHEKFYGQAPLETAIKLQEASNVLKTLADRWIDVEPAEHGRDGKYTACEDLNETASIQAHGVLFMEGDTEPVELVTLKRDLATSADDYRQAGEWLFEAMEASWEAAQALVPVRALADVLGERHRIIANDWQAASLSSLAARLLRRALDILDQIDFAPDAVRADLRAGRSLVPYLYSASELIDRAADLVSEFAMLVHDNERRWRVFRQQVVMLTREQAT
jgi:hypothetical protein